MRLEKKIAIVGCGHSGTFYISEVFQHLGVDIRHEVMGADGIAGWNYTHLSRDGFTDFGLEKDAIVFHQVRHPLNVISSLQAMEEATWIEVGRRASWRKRFWNPLEDEHPIRGMKYWLLWNEFASSIANYRYKVEDIETVLSVMLKMLGLPAMDLPHVSRNINKHEYKHTYSWSELEEANTYLYKKVLALSEEYGY